MHRQIRRVFATGGAALSALGIAVAIVACGGTTTAPQAPQPSGPPGAQLWIQRHKLPPRSGPGFVQVVAVSPRGDKVYMTGEGATVAYSAATGARLWASQGGASVAVSPDGSKVFVTRRTGNPGHGGGRGPITPRPPTTPLPARSCGPAATMPRASQAATASAPTPCS